MDFTLIIGESVPYIYETGKVLDDLGLVRDNNYLVVYIPPTNKAFVFWVEGRENSGYEVLHYGPLPLLTSITCTGYTGNNLSPPATGVIPPMNYCPSLLPPPPTLIPYPSGDLAQFMFYYEKADKLFQVRMFVRPKWLRTQIQIPPGSNQNTFNENIVGVGYSGGFGRGYLEYVVFPGLIYSFLWGNDMVYGAFTGLDIIYGEYHVSLVTDLDILYEVLTHQLPSAWVVFPVVRVDTTVNDKWVKYYGFTGVDVPAPGTQKQQWINKVRGELPR